MGDELRRLANRVYNGERFGRERPVRERPVRERPVRERPVRERRVIEIRKREEKGIYVEKSLDLLRGCSAGVLRIIYDEFPLVFNIKYTSEKLNFIALNYPTKDIENAIIRAEEQIKRERLERERLERERLERERLEREEKGIYVDKSLDLLGGCSTEVIMVLYDKFDVSDIKQDSEKLNYIALNYPTQDIENEIIRAEDQIKREHMLPYIIGVIIILILLLIFLSML